MLQNIERLPCLRMLFCVNRRFNFLCRQRLVSLKSDYEARIRDDIKFVMRLDMPGIDSSAQSQINEIMWRFIQTALGKERVLHKLHIARKELDLIYADIRGPVVKLEQLFVKVQGQQKRLQAIINENNPIPDTIVPKRNGQWGEVCVADILIKDVDDLHKKIMSETSDLIGEVNSLMAIVKLVKRPLKVEMQLVRLHALINESNSKMQVLTDHVATRATRSRTRKPVEIPQDDVLLVADMRSQIIGQALTLQEEAKVLSASVKERLAEAKLSSLRYKSLLLKLNRSVRQGFNQLEKEIRKCWVRLANVGSRAWIAGRRAAMWRIHTTLADRLRIGARTRTKVDRPTREELERGCEVAVSFAEEFEGY